MSLYQTPICAYSVFEKPHPPNPIWEKGYHPFRFVWGSSDKIHSLVCQQGNPIIERKSPTEIDFIYLLDPVEGIEDKEIKREIIFYLDAGEEREFLVSGQRSSTFHIGEKISIHSGQKQFLFQFFLEEGEGKFLGHRMLGNRPSQLEIKGAKRYQAYDWMFFLRSVHRTQKCRVRVALTILGL